MILVVRIPDGPMRDRPINPRRGRGHLRIVRRLTVRQLLDRPTGHVLRIAS